MPSQVDGEGCTPLDTAVLASLAEGERGGGGEGAGEGGEGGEGAEGGEGGEGGEGAEGGEGGGDAFLRVAALLRRAGGCSALRTCPGHVHDLSETSPIGGRRLGLAAGRRRVGPRASCCGAAEAGADAADWVWERRRRGELCQPVRRSPEITRDYPRLPEITRGELGQPVRLPR